MLYYLGNSVFDRFFKVSFAAVDNLSKYPKPSQNKHYPHIWRKSCDGLEDRYRKEAKYTSCKNSAAKAMSYALWKAKFKRLGGEHFPAVLAEFE